MMEALQLLDQQTCKDGNEPEEVADSIKIQERPPGEEGPCRRRSQEEAAMVDNQVYRQTSWG